MKVFSILTTVFSFLQMQIFVFAAHAQENSKVSYKEIEYIIPNPNKIARAIGGDRQALWSNPSTEFNGKNVILIGAYAFGSEKKIESHEGQYFNRITIPSRVTFWEMTRDVITLQLDKNAAQAYGEIYISHEELSEDKKEYFSENCGHSRSDWQSLYLEECLIMVAGSVETIAETGDREIVGVRVHEFEIIRGETINVLNMYIESYSDYLSVYREVILFAVDFHSR